MIRKNMRYLTWNIGSFVFTKYLGLFHRHGPHSEYFLPEHNAGLVSNTIIEIDPDFVFLQEFYFEDHVEEIAALKQYPHSMKLDTWYRKRSAYIGSKTPFSVEEVAGYHIIHHGDRHIIPVHLHSFSSHKRYTEALALLRLCMGRKRVLLLGDTNLWTRGKFFLFQWDRRTYDVLGNFLCDHSTKAPSTTYLGFGLDKIMASHDIAISHIASPQIRGKFMDHYPLYCDVAHEGSRRI